MTDKIEQSRLNSLKSQSSFDTSFVVPMRLQKFLARAGVASRRGSENLMTAGRVKVNGEVCTELGTKVDPNVDIVLVDDKPIHLSNSATYIMLDKPAGYLTTMMDPQSRPCVAQIVPTNQYPGLFPVGRLDKDTTGLLLFTTDGDMAQNLLHPSKHVSKRYIAMVDGLIHDDELNPLRQGIILDDGPCKPARCRILHGDETQSVCPYGVPSGFSVCEIIISEGRKNQVKRMMGKIHHPVIRLRRESFGPLELCNVEYGHWRHLTSTEVEKLRTTISLNTSM